ncbi:MAG: aminoglycoside phosphotransferase family protein, partial [Caldilineaceae bacterium]|nr:aminoglycoside phosphotransferase family protein [Caldilineaceae bacterium]
KALTANGQALTESALPLWQGIAPTPVHGDLKLENVLSSFGVVLLLDWELFGLGDAAHDVASFLAMNRNLLDEEMRELWLEQYLASFSQPGLRQRIGVYERILPLHQLLYLLHGLRQSSPADLPLLRANQSFLTATILAAIEQSSAALHVMESTITEDEIANLFEPKEQS